MAKKIQREKRKLKVFLCYRGSETSQVQFVANVNGYLKRQFPALTPLFYPDHEDAGPFPPTLGQMVRSAQAFVLFASDRLGGWQKIEIKLFSAGPKNRKWLIVRMKTNLPREREFKDFAAGVYPISVRDGWEDDLHESAYMCAKEIALRLGVDGTRPDRPPIREGIPEGYPYEYEKTIIDELLTPGARIHKYLETGWPMVSRVHATQPIPSSAKIGELRDEKMLIVDARSDKQRAAGFALPEAGTRKYLAFPSGDKKQLNVGIVVSGGIAPGINAVIDGIVSRHYLYKQGGIRLDIRGYTEGFKGVIATSAKNYVDLTSEMTSRVRHTGGSMLGTSRLPELMTPNPDVQRKSLDKIIDHLKETGVEIFYVIGGDGSMRAAHAIALRSQERKQLDHADDGETQLSVVGIPKTMDNDILWVWQAFGFLSAVEKARDIISNLKTEVESNPRVSIIQLFGSDSGFVVAHAALASGCCDYALIPEVDFSLDQLSQRVCKVLEERKGSGLPYFVIVMAETAIPTDVVKYLDQAELTEKERTAIQQFAHLGPYTIATGQPRRVSGQTPDELRTGGLKLVKHVLERKIREIRGFGNYFKDFRVVTNEPRHILRASPPSVSDVIFGERLGGLAVDAAMAGYRDCMISQWLTEYMLVPLELVVLGRKRVPRNGIFWKSVLARTKQEENSGA